jgi:hypothetical protein
MTSNYPPGVSGFEPEIVGRDSREDIDHREASCQNDECVEFDKLEEREIILTKEYSSHNVIFEFWTYKCPTCGTSADFESEYEYDGYDG